MMDRLSRFESESAVEEGCGERDFRRTNDAVL